MKKEGRSTAVRPKCFEVRLQHITPVTHEPKTFLVVVYGHHRRAAIEYAREQACTQINRNRRFVCVCEEIAVIGLREEGEE